jgi:AAA domain, putative AbiEii toxin, Type IV TA system
VSPNVSQRRRTIGTMPFTARLRRIVISDGTLLDLPPTGVIAIVGPNNAGKSVALREIAQFLTLPASPATTQWQPLVVKDLEVEKEGSEADLLDWLETHAIGRDIFGGGRQFRRASGVDAPLTTLSSEWTHGFKLGSTLTQFLVLQSGAGDRLGLLGGGTGMWDSMNDTPSNALQVLYADPDLEARFSATCIEAFREPVTLSRAPGTPISLYLGQTSESPVLEGVLPNPAYIDELRRLPTLANQGDGIRSFMGLMLALMTAQYPIILVDEPEAFLHPPQARQLGRKIAAEATDRAQVILATHSTDVLIGLLDDPAASLTVVRMT